MLPPYIIEELRRRERARREEATQPQPRLELPLEMPRRHEPVGEKTERGLAIIEVWG